MLRIAAARVCSDDPQGMTRVRENPSIGKLFQRRRVVTGRHVFRCRRQPRSGGIASNRLAKLTGRKTTERRYYLGSLPLDVELFARAVRSHWGVEKKVHWIMDVCFHEDQSRARAGYAAENLATLRRLGLNMLKRESTKKRGIKGKQLNAGWDHAYLLRLLGI